MEGLIVPSKYYGIEAAGRPVVYIGDKNGEIPNLIKQAKNGASFEIGDSVGVSDFILKLSKDQAFCEQMGMSGRAIFEQIHDEEVSIRAWEQLLTDALDEQSGKVSHEFQ